MKKKELIKILLSPLEIIKGKTQAKKFIGANVGDVLVLKTKGLFADDHQNQTYLDVSQ